MILANATTGSVSVLNYSLLNAFPPYTTLKPGTITAELPENLNATLIYLRAALPVVQILSAHLKLEQWRLSKKQSHIVAYGYCGAIGYISFCGNDGY